jgi:Ca2+/H+ antiporter, TMEM165/GDT1 family
MLRARRQSEGVDVGLAALFEQFYPVVLGTTLGMMLANVPAVLTGDRIADKLPVTIRLTAASCS